MILIRTYEPKDYEMIAGWHSEHKVHHRPPGPFVPPEVLPPLGQIAFRQEDGEDLAVMFLYLAQAIPVGFVEHALTKPKLPLRTSIEALSALLLCLKQAATHMGCLMVMGHTVPAIARYMKRADWNESARGLVRMWSLTMPENANV